MKVAKQMTATDIRRAQGPVVHVPAPTMTPPQLLQMAVTQGADLDKLERLMDLQKKWEADEARKAFVVALNAFKAEPTEILKNKHVKFGTTDYHHATLDNVCTVIGTALTKHGLSHRWEVEQKDGVINVSCVLQHELGHTERVTMGSTPDTSGSKNSIQAVGSTTTYLQRYTLLAATGLATKGQDDDGARGAGQMPEKQRIDFENAIDALADTTGISPLWQEITKACIATGDLGSHDAFKAKITDKTKKLKEKK